MRYYGIRSTSGREASYWNVFLLVIICETFEVSLVLYFLVRPAVTNPERPPQRPLDRFHLCLLYFFTNLKGRLRFHRRVSVHGGGVGVEYPGIRSLLGTRVSGGRYSRELGYTLPEVEVIAAVDTHPTGILSCCRPQCSCCKVIFLYMSVILSTGGGVWQTPPWADTPLGQIPSGQTPPWVDTPLGRHPLGRHPSLCRHPTGQTPP